jgi:hypothetical protein
MARESARAATVVKGGIVSPFHEALSARAQGMAGLGLALALASGWAGAQEEDVKLGSARVTVRALSSRKAPDAGNRRGRALYSAK